MSRKRIAILVHTENEWSRQVLMGVAQYAQENGGWDFTHPKADENGEVALPSHWRGDGIICRLTSDALRQQVVASQVPAVNVSWLGEHSAEIVKVVSDEVACGRMVAEYFLDRQFRHFGFVGPPDWQKYEPSVADSIRTELARKDIQLNVFHFPPRESYQDRIRNSLEEWIVEQERPLALITWSSKSGLIASSVCDQRGIPVPNDVAILCIEHDDLASSLSATPLSNLDQDPWRVGFTAAESLDQRMQGAAPPDSLITIPPLSVVQRRSTESSAVDDPIVREAYRFIHEQVANGLNVSSVVRELGVARRTLETKFRKHLGKSPAEVIRQVKLQIVKRLLRETTLTIPQIGERSSFSHPEVLIRAFKRDTGLTPTQFRHGKL